MVNVRNDRVDIDIAIHATVAIHLKNLLASFIAQGHSLIKPPAHRTSRRARREAGPITNDHVNLHVPECGRHALALAAIQRSLWLPTDSRNIDYLRLVYSVRHVLSLSHYHSLNCKHSQLLIQLMP